MEQIVKLFNYDCIDVMQSQDFMELKRNGKVIIVTDPPFNVGYHYATYKDNLKEENYYNMLDSVFNMYDFPFVVIHYPESIYKISFKVKRFPEKIVSWVYNSNTSKQHRDIAFFGVKPNFKQVLQPYKNQNDKRIKERIARGCKGAKLYDWWEINQVKNVSREKTAHPCQMPLEVMKRIIGILPKDAIIMDPFMGSGTTGIAVIEMNKEQEARRKFIGCEIDKEYFEISNKRISKTTEQQQKNYKLMDLLEEVEE